MHPALPRQMSFLEVRLNNWQRPERCEKTSETNLCSNEDVLGGARWSFADGTLWQSENSVKHGIHPQEIQNKRDLVLFQASFGVSQTFIAHRLIFLAMQLFCGSIKFYIKAV